MQVKHRNALYGEKYMGTAPNYSDHLADVPCDNSGDVLSGVMNGFGRCQENVTYWYT